MNAGTVIAARAALDALGIGQSPLREVVDFLSTPPADDVREAAQTFADHVGWNWDALDPMWRERFEQAARKVLVRPHGTVTDTEVEAAARSLAGLSEAIWAELVQEGRPELAYYVDQARAALGAAREVHRGR